MAEHEGSFLSLGEVEEVCDSMEHVCQSEPVNASTSMGGEHLCKKRHLKLNGNFTDSKRRSNSLFTTDLTEKRLLDDSSLTDLGITGIITFNDIDPELANIFPTPSPTIPRRSSNFLIGKKTKSDGENQQETHWRGDNTEITKNRDLSIFDSPEDGKRGWSELGLRLRRPNKDPECQSVSHSCDGYFTFIADEIILSIFEKMPKSILVKCARVCKRWRRIAYDESLWRRLDLGGKIIRDGVLGSCVLSRGVEYLRLSACEVGEFYSPGRSGRLLCQLEYLDLTMATISLRTLGQLLSSCTHLKKLSLENLAVNDHICSIISRNTKLTTLNCAMSTGLTFKGLTQIFGSCILLEELNVSWIKLPATDVNLVVNVLPPGLLRLNFSGCRENMDDASVALLTTICTRLTELDLSDSLGVTEQSVYYIVHKLKSLHTLHLSRCYYIAPHSYETLRELPNLKTLNIHSMLPEHQLCRIGRCLASARINQDQFSTISRPTVGLCRTSIWGCRVRDIAI